MLDQRTALDDTLRTFGIPNEEIPRRLEEALGPVRAERLRMMVDRRRPVFRSSSLTVLNGLARERLPAGARLNRMACEAVLRVEEHHSAISAVLGRGPSVRQRDLLHQSLFADERALERLEAKPGNPLSWMREHAHKWASHCAAVCELRDRRSLEAQRDQPQARSTEMRAGSPALEQIERSPVDDVGIDF